MKIIFEVDYAGDVTTGSRLLHCFALCEGVIHIEEYKGGKRQ